MFSAWRVLVIEFWSLVTCHLSFVRRLIIVHSLALFGGAQDRPKASKAESGGPKADVTDA